MTLLPLDSEKPVNRGPNYHHLYMLQYQIKLCRRLKEKGDYKA